MMKNGVYFIVIALLVAELFKILIYANYILNALSNEMITNFVSWAL